jgi:hypothetical protein
MPGVRRNQPWVWSPYPVCTSSGPVTITAIRPVRPINHMRVVDWGVKNDATSDAVNDGRPGRSTSLAGFSETRVTTKCALHPRRFSDLDVSVVIESPQATAHGFTVRWRSADGAGASYIPFMITECTSGRSRQVAGGGTTCR